MVSLMQQTTLVAEAYTNKYTVVTREAESDSTHVIKIPSICDELQIGCMGPFEMLNSEKVRFILD